MKTSGTKPMKNTMRKPSPLKFFTPVTVGKDAVKKVSDASKKSWKTIKEKRDAAKAAGTTKGATTSGTYMDKKKAAKPTAETSVKTGTIKSNPAGKPASKTETSVKSPTMQMKKSGMGKKC